MKNAILVQVRIQGVLVRETYIALEDLRVLHEWLPGTRMEVKLQEGILVGDVEVPSVSPCQGILGVLNALHL